MSDLKIFENNAFGKVRVQVVNEVPMFCLADVCKALDLSQTNKVKERLSSNGWNTIPVIDSMGRKQDATFITESNLYKCVFQSRKPDAEKFQDWVCEDVLPSIRKHGAYMTGETLEKALTSPDFLIKLATNLKEEKEKRIAAEQKIVKDAPKVLFAEAVSTSQRSCLVSELAKIIQQNGVKIGQNRLFEWMRNNGYLCSKGQYYNQPTQKSMNLGLFELKQTTITKPSGEVLVTTTPKVTGKGQVYFINKFLQKKVA